jgi:hypothetical protein
MTIADRLREIAEESPGHFPDAAPMDGCIGCKLNAIAKELDEKANALVSVGRTHYACELAATLGGNGYNRDIPPVEKGVPGFSAPIKDYHDLCGYYERTGSDKDQLDEEIEARGWDADNLSAEQLDLLADQADELQLNRGNGAANQNTSQQIDSGEYLGADRE